MGEGRIGDGLQAIACRAAGEATCRGRLPLGGPRPGRL